ncbi:hypothetical protein P3W45_000612 [Vairimorpha bombi]|jgi:hypothetical protein
MYTIHILLAYSTTLFLEYDISFTSQTHILICIKDMRESLIFSRIEDTIPDKYNEIYSFSSVCMRFSASFSVHKQSLFFFPYKRSCLMDFIDDKDLLFFSLKIPQSSRLENLTFKMFYWDSSNNFKYETEIKYLKDLLGQREIVFDFRSDRGPNNIAKNTIK